MIVLQRPDHTTPTLIWKMYWRTCSFSSTAPVTFCFSVWSDSRIDWKEGAGQPDEFYEYMCKSSKCFRFSTEPRAWQERIIGGFGLDIGARNGISFARQIPLRDK